MTVLRFLAGTGVLALFWLAFVWLGDLLVTALGASDEVDDERDDG